MFGGNRVELARAAGIDPSPFYRFFNKGATGRNIGDMNAERIEKAARKPAGWLDTPHWEDNILEIKGKAPVKHENPLRAEINALLDKLDNSKLELVLYVTGAIQKAPSAASYLKDKKSPK